MENERGREKREWSILIMRNWPKNVINIILKNHYAMENFVDKDSERIDGWRTPWASLTGVVSTPENFMSPRCVELFKTLFFWKNRTIGIFIQCFRHADFQNWLLFIFLFVYLHSDSDCLFYNKRRTEAQTDSKPTFHGTCSKTNKRYEFTNIMVTKGKLRK